MSSIAPPHRRSNYREHSDVIAPMSSGVNLAVVLGMHRCGTSALARGLIELGVDLGDNLMEAVNAYNVKGFWENLDVVGLNERLLGALDSRWDAIAPITDWRVNDPAIADLHALAVETLSRTAGPSRPFGFKDPRTTRLLPFWRDVFRAAGMQPGYVIALRNPLSVAASLHTRDQFAAEKSCLLWLQHLLAAVSDTVGHPRVIVDYDRLLDNPPREMGRIADAFGWKKPSAEKLARSVYVRRFLTPSMRHTHYPPRSLSGQPAFGGIVELVYETLLRVADSSLSIDSLPETPEWRRIESTWQDLSRFLPYLGDRERRLEHSLGNFRNLNEAKAQLEEGYRTFETNLRQREKAADAALTEAQEREQRVADLSRELTETQRRIESLTKSRSWRATAPIRGISETLKITKGRLGRLIRDFYIAIPLKVEHKLQAKSFVFSTLRPVFSRTASYQAWVAFERMRHSREVGVTESTALTTDEHTSPASARSPTSLPELLAPILSARVANGDTLGSHLARLPRMPEACPGKRRVLMIDLWLPTPDRSSGSARQYALLKFMHQSGYSVDLLLHHRKDEHHLHPAIQLSAAELGRYEGALRSIGVQVTYGAAQGLRELVTTGHLYANVWLCFPEIAFEYLPWIRAYATNAQVIFDSIDLHYLRLAREAEVSGNPEKLELASYYRKIETVCAGCADVTVAITERERDLLRELAPGSRVTVVPNVHELATHIPAFSERKDLFFIGGFSHRPNVDAVHYFATDIFPLIREDIPHIECVIVGSNMPDSIRSLQGSGIRALGYVEDASSYFEASRVFIVPLRYGAGMKGKLGQALSYGLPSVTTSIGAEGMLLEHGQHTLIADSPGDFARAVLSLYNDPLLWAQISANGLKHLDQMFSTRSIKQNISSLLSGTSSNAELLSAASDDGDIATDFGQSR
ncbi:glycosyltransferase [Methylolobus aquaticus]